MPTSDQPLLVTATVREYEMQPGQGMPPMPPGAPQATVEPSVAPPQQGGVGTLQISVPTGCQAGQTLQFTPPGHAQPLSVVMQQQVPPGSVVTVQYPTVQPAPTAGLPGVAQQGHAPMQYNQPQYNQPGALPPMQYNMQEDITGRNYGWGLYFGGAICCCFIPAVGCCFGTAMWALVAGMYYCKPPAQRAQLPQSRTPALTALISGIVCCIILTVLSCVMMFTLADCMTVDQQTGEPYFENCGWLQPYIDNDPNQRHHPPAPHWTPYPTAAGFEVKSVDTSVHV